MSDYDEFVEAILAAGATKFKKKGMSEGYWFPPHNLGINVPAMGGVNLWVYNIFKTFPEKGSYLPPKTDKYGEYPEGLVLRPMWDPHPKYRNDSFSLSAKTADILARFAKGSDSVGTTTKRNFEALEKHFDIKIPSAIKSRYISQAPKIAKRRWSVNRVRMPDTFVPFDGGKEQKMPSWGRPKKGHTMKRVSDQTKTAAMGVAKLFELITAMNTPPPKKARQALETFEMNVRDTMERHGWTVDIGLAGTTTMYDPSGEARAQVTTQWHEGATFHSVVNGVKRGPTKDGRKAGRLMEKMMAESPKRAGDQNLRKAVIRLAHQKPELRDDLLPLVKEGAFDPMKGLEAVSMAAQSAWEQWKTTRYRLRALHRQLAKAGKLPYWDDYTLQAALRHVAALEKQQQKMGRQYEAFLKQLINIDDIPGVDKWSS